MNPNDYTIIGVDWGKEPLPPWAVAHNEGYYMIEGTQLMTRDGRLCGNAYVDTIKVQTYNYHDRQLHLTLAVCYTDAGNKMTMLLEELKEYFHKPKYIMNKFEARKARGVK